MQYTHATTCTHLFTENGADDILAGTRVQIANTLPSVWNAMYRRAMTVYTVVAPNGTSAQLYETGLTDFGNDAGTPPERVRTTVTYRKAICLRWTLAEALFAFTSERMTERDYLRFYRLWQWGMYPKSTPETDDWFLRRGKQSYRHRADRAGLVVATILQRGV